ncbi:MAG: Dabb family protein [Pseudomonadota bacterium]
MFRHCVLFRFKDSVTAETIEAIEAALHGLRQLPMVRRYEFGCDAVLAEGNFDFALVADFDDQTGYEAYAQDPEHQRVLAEMLRPNIAERAAVQYAL